MSLILFPYQIISMMRFIQKHKIKIAFALLGAIGGFLYWKFVGCQSGTCPIKSVWYLTTLWGAALGYLLGDIISGYLKKKEIKENE
jgi:hypothetical protein